MRCSADRVFLTVAIAALLVGRILVIPVRFFDPDELEHAHAAWSVFNGLLPYRDFFEHHTPWYAFALSPFFRWFAVDQSFASAEHFLFFARGVSLALTVVSVALMFLIGRRAATRRSGLLAALFLVAQPAVIQKTLEIRPDVLALPCFLGALWFLLRGLRGADGSTPPAARWFFGGGVCLGAAIMCTQKMLFVVPGALFGLALWAWGGGRSSYVSRLRAVLTLGVGLSVPVALTWLAFAVHGGGGQFIRDNFLLNARMSLRSSRHLREVASSWPVLALAVVGAAVGVHRFYRGGRRDYWEIFLLSTLGGLGVGAVVVPAAYRQYYLMPLAIACLLAATGFCFLVDRLRGPARERARAWLVVGAIAPLLVLPIVDLARSYARRNDAQLARLRYVLEHTRPTDTVLDGWLGTGVFRPHPLYYFFMHREVLAMLSEEDKDAYLAPLESGAVRPSLIALDPELLALGPRFVRFLQQNYVSHDGLFYFPKRAR